MDSESQVRLYVNTRLGCWGAWAFPQEARTGMSAREIATPETPEQAVERFAAWDSEPSADWRYFCTAHHHCSASAFQSGTDEANERNQDGLHLTVGRMDAERHDLHARFYLAGNCFEPDLSLFWPVPPELAEQVPPNLLDALARFQMGAKVVVDFPDAWRKNVIAVLADNRQAHGQQMEGPLQRSDQHSLELRDIPEWLRAEHALAQIAEQCEGIGVAEAEFLAMLKYVAGDSPEGIILEACLKHQVLPEDILDEVQQFEPGF
jgi:hypothetical protein